MMSNERKWTVGPVVKSQGVFCRDVLIDGMDRFNGGFICNATDEMAHRIVDDHNAHSALVEALKEVEDEYLAKTVNVSGNLLQVRLMEMETANAIIARLRIALANSTEQNPCLANR